MIIHRPPANHRCTRRKIVLLSGLSDPGSCALSKVQHRFLGQLAASEEEKILANFPYRMEDAMAGRSPSLLQASWENGRQFLQASRRGYCEAATRHWNALARSCEELTVITLSCGLEILNGCLIAGVRPRSLQVISLGPVAWARPPAVHTLIQGSRDYISKPFFQTAEVMLPGVGHLNYLDRPETIEIVNHLLSQSA